MAAALDRSGAHVVVVARESTAAELANRGLSVHSAVLGDLEAHPRITAALEDDVDVLIVATKATGLVAALNRVQGTPDLVVPLLNGLDHLELLRERFGAHHVASGVIRIESDRPRTGTIVQTSPACRVDLATEQPKLKTHLKRLADILQNAGIPVQIDSSERHVMWSKLARLCPLALTSSASDRPIGFVRSDPRWRSALENAIAETVEVANADGAALAPTATLAELESAPPELGSSMQRDIAAGREPELDAIAGGVLRAGARHEIRCPTLVWLSERVAKRAGIAVPA